MQLGDRQEHRPDLPPLQWMAAAAPPSGQRIAWDVHPGPCADAPLYPPLLQRVRRLLGRTGLLYAGDCTMAAWTTRAARAAPQDSYVMPLPRTSETAAPWTQGVDAIVDGPQEATLRWDGACLRGAGYEWARPLSAPVEGQPVPWTARVQVVRSRALAQRQAVTLEKRVAASEAAWRALTPAPGRGKRQIRDEAALQAAIARVVAQHDVAGLLTVTWRRYETPQTHSVGRGRGGPQRLTRTEVDVRYVITDVQQNEAAVAARPPRLGWRVQVPKAPGDTRSLTESVGHSRGGWSLERDFHLVKDLPVGLSPLLVWKEEQRRGMPHLLTLALRLLTLLETQVRRGLEHPQEVVAGLDEGQPTRTTSRPTGQRILHALARAQLTLTHTAVGTATCWHLTPLSPLHEQLLRHLGLPPSLYTALADNAS